MMIEDISPLEIKAFMELREKIIKLMNEFIDEHGKQDSPLYPKVGYLLVDSLTSCLQDAHYQVVRYQPFTTKQIDHICYQIGEWYLMMKPLLEGQHNLGYMKEKLKTMICEE